MTSATTPNRVDARTIRAALKAAGITRNVRITSGRHVTYVELRDEDGSPVCPVPDRPGVLELLLGALDTTDEADLIVAALRPLWNDDRVRTSLPWSVTIERAGWHTTAPLEAELELLEAAGVPAPRVAELREDSTREERVAELGEVLDVVPGTLTTVLVLDGGNVRLKLGAGDVARHFPGTGDLYSSHHGGPWERCVLAGLDGAVGRYRLARSLLVEVDKRVRPVRPVR